MKEYRLKHKGYAVRYHEFPGAEPPLVMIHGLGCASSFEYPGVVTQPPLAARRTILIDMLGAGYSDKPIDFGYSVEDHAAYLNEMLTALNLNDIILFGHSLGGAVAIVLAVLLQDRLRQLILTESNLDPSPAGATSRKIASYSKEDFLAKGYAHLLSRAQKRNPLWAATFAGWLPEAAWHISRSAVRGGTPSWRDVLYNLQKPKSFFIGELSLPEASDPELSNHGVRVELIPSAGHAMALENPAVLAERIASVIADAFR